MAVKHGLRERQVHQDISPPIRRGWCQENNDEYCFRGLTTVPNAYNESSNIFLESSLNQSSIESSDISSDKCTPACTLNNLTSLVGRFYAGSVLNV